MENLRFNSQRAKTAIALIWITLAIEMISLASGYIQYDLLKSLQNGVDFSEESLTSNDSRQQIIVFVYLIAYIISIITFIQWFRRAYFNLHIKAKNLSYTEGWAAGSWFVPILNLFRPYQIMKELYVETNTLLTKHGLIGSNNLTSNFVGVWWTIWIVNSIIGQVVFRLSKNAESIDEMITVTVISLFANIIAIPLSFITVKVIKDYSAVEPLMFDIVDEEVSTNAYDHLV